MCLPELAITGYGCEDAFFMDGLQHTAFAQLERLAAFTAGMVVSVGLPLYHEKALYNGAALLVDGIAQVRRGKVSVTHHHCQRLVP